MTEPASDPATEATDPSKPSMRQDLIGIVAILTASALAYAIAAGF